MSSQPTVDPNSKIPIHRIPIGAPGTKGIPLRDDDWFKRQSEAKKRAAEQAEKKRWEDAERQADIEARARARYATQSEKPISVTLNKHIDDWTVTSDEYLPLINHHIRPGLGHYRLDELNKNIIAKWVNGLKNAKTGADLSRGTKSRALRCLHKILEDAIPHKLKYNPATGVKIVSNGTDDEDEPPIPFEEADLAILLADKTTKYHDHYAGAVATGMRRGSSVP